MKNGLVIWNVVLTVLTGYLLFVNFGKKDTTGSNRTANKDSLINENVFRIGYIEMDSIEANYELVKKVQSEIQQQEAKYSKNLNALDQSYRSKLTDMQKRVEGGNMTQESYEKAQLEMHQFEESLKGRKQAYDTEFQEFVTKQNMGLKKKIEEYVAEYNKNNSYSYVVVYEPSLFYYRDTIYNITNDIVNGLNEAYAKEKK